MGDSHPSVFPDSLTAEIFPAVMNGAALRLHIAGQDLHGLFLAVAFDTGNSQHFSLFQGEIQVVQFFRAELIGIAQVFHRQYLIAELLQRLIILQFDVAPHHQS